MRGKGKYDFVSDLRTHHQILFALLVAIGIVALWRGLWGVMDVLILPDNYLWSSIVSVIIAAVILGGLHMFVSEILAE